MDISRKNSNTGDDPHNNTAKAIPAAIPYWDVNKTGVVQSGFIRYENDDSGIYRNYRQVDWTITLNAQNKLTMLPTDEIWDIFYRRDNQYMYYYHDPVTSELGGLTVTRVNAAGQTVGEPVFLKWSQSLCKPQGGTFKPLSDLFPAYDGKKKPAPIWKFKLEDVGVTEGTTDEFVITYSTLADVSNLTWTAKPKNTVYTTRAGEQAYDIEIHKPGPAETIPVGKRLVESNNKECTWEVTLHVDKAGYDSYVFTDYLPYWWLGDDLYFNSLKSWEFVDNYGLLEGESYTGGTVVQVNSWNQPRLVITFNKAVNGETKPGLLPSPDGQGREIKLKIVTSVDQDWVHLTTNVPPDESWRRDHTNRAEVHARSVDGTYWYGVGRANISLSEKTVSKRWVDKGSVFLEDGTIGTIPNWNGSPYYYFQTSLACFEDNDGKPIVVKDTFDTTRFRLQENTFKVWFSTFGNHASSDTELTSDKYTFENTEDGFTVTIAPENILLNGTSSFYPYIHFTYTLVPKDTSALTQMTQDAALNMGTAWYQNTAEVDGLDPASDEFIYTYDPLIKLPGAARQDGNNYFLDYRLTLNPAKALMNGGQEIEVADTHSDNLAIDYLTIKVERAEDADGKDRTGDVHYDYSGNTGWFYIPDGTEVVLTYTGKVIGDVSDATPVTNDVSMLDYHDGTSETEIQWSIHPTATVYMLNLFKYSSDHMESGLNGATFRLLDANKMPMKYLEGPNRGKDITFTTGKVNGLDGYAEIYLNHADTGVVINKNTVYYLEEIQAPTRLLDNGKTEYYKRDFVLYSFLISDNPDYSAPGGVYVFGNGDVLKVRNRPDTGGFYLVKQFNGNVQPPESVLQNAYFVISRQNDDGGYTEVDRLTYAGMSGGTAYIDTLPVGHYRVEEFEAEPPAAAGLTFITEYDVDGVAQEADAVEFDIYQDDIDDLKSHSVVITNTYYEKCYSVTKVDSQSLAALRGAEFTAY